MRSPPVVWRAVFRPGRNVRGWDSSPRPLMPPRGTVSRAVCNNCWTWYQNGETVCPQCRIPLMVADDGAPAFTAGGVTGPAQAPAPAASGIAPPPTPDGFDRIRLLPVAGVAAVPVIRIAVLASHNLGGPAVAHVGSFSVKATGW